DQVLLNLITHSPLFARYSPGELHTLMVGAELAKEAIPVFDLTPGGHYKDRYATAYDEVYVIIVFFARSHCVRYKLKRKLAEAAKSAIKALNIAPDQARDAFSTFLDWRKKWLQIKPTDLLSELYTRLRRRFWHRNELCVYACNPNQLVSQPGLGLLNRDSIADVLSYQPTQAWQSPVNKFMKQALEYLEAGHHVYTRVDNGKLIQYSWLMESQE